MFAGENAWRSFLIDSKRQRVDGHDQGVVEYNGNPGNRSEVPDTNTSRFNGSSVETISSKDIQGKQNQSKPTQGTKPNRLRGRERS